MENVAFDLEVTTDARADSADLTAIVELSANELALVGGGTANVSFM
jgi:hypothetical protein